MRTDHATRNDLLSSDEVLERLGADPETLARLRPGGRPSRPCFYSRAAIDEFLASLPVWTVKDKNEPGGLLGIHLCREDALSDRDANRRTHRIDEDGRKVRTVPYVEKAKALLIPAK